METEKREVGGYMKAVVNGDRIECGECGAWLFSHVVFKDGKLNFDKKVCLQSAEYEPGIVHKIKIKCKNKDKGHTCNTINEINL
jgi:hypothetical protein